MNFVFKSSSFFLSIFAGLLLTACMQVESLRQSPGLEASASIQNTLVASALFPTAASVLAPTSDRNRRPFRGKKAVMLGTSLTSQGLYLPYLKTRTELETILNRGVSGQLVRTMADKLTAADVNGAALISIEGSTNDYGHGFSVAGQVTDPASTASICGDVKYVVQKIRSLNASVPIVVMNDTWRGPYYHHPVPPAPNPYGLTLEDASNAMMDVAAYLHLAHWDAYHWSGISELNYSDYTYDNLHWNEEGAALIGNGLGDYLNTL